MNANSSKVSIFPSQLLKSFRDAVIWTTRSNAESDRVNQLLARTCQLSQIFPVQWDASSTERKLPDILNPFYATGSTIEKIVDARRRLLDVFSNNFHIGDGQLMLYEPSLTLQDGVSHFNSDGFFDMADCPPPDCWIAYMVNETSLNINLSNPQQGNIEIDYLISFIPSKWLRVANQGIESNSTACLRWIDEQFIKLHPALLPIIQEVGSY